MDFCGKALGAVVVLAFFAIPPANGQDSTQAFIQTEILKTHKTRISAYPYVYYTPETAFAIGAGGITTFYTSQSAVLRASKIALSGYYSTRKQYRFSLGPQLYLAQNSIFLSADVNFGKYVDKFWGIGRDTPDIENEDYDSRAWGLTLNFQFPPLLKILPRRKSGIIYDFYQKTITNTKGNPFLEAGDLTGTEGGLSSGLGLAFVWDTRTHIFYPTAGGFYQLRGIFYRNTFGSDFNFDHYEIDLRKYLSILKDRVLAFQLFASFQRGNPPFYELSLLGGSHIMRGYFQGRYRDKNLLAGQVEFRTHLWRRLGAVGFAGMGDVIGKISDFRIRTAKFSAGFGLRFIFNRAEHVNLRMDIGFGRDTNGVYFGLEEAF